MAEMMTTDVRAIMDRTPFDVAAVADLREVLNRDPSRYRTLREAVADHQGPREGGRCKPETHLRLGVGEVLLGRYQVGPRAPEEGRRRGHGLLLPRARPREPAAATSEAAAAFAAGRQAGLRRQELRAAPRRRAPPGRASSTRRRRSSPGSRSTAGRSAEYHFQQRLPARRRRRAGRRPPPSSRRRSSLDHDHNGALFELAYINDLYGNDDVAVDYYKRCTERPPVPLAAWINLGILYEDEMRFREAEQCYRQVLAHDPNHPRARLFFKDCQASKEMYYDEEAERGYTVLKQLHEIPVTDFELSVRSRNCLRKMNIRTLGDLTRTTEAALLSSKNFGETSLAEIKEMMQAKGLRLGMALEGSERVGHDHRIEPTAGSSRPSCRRC